MLQMELPVLVAADSTTSDNPKKDSNQNTFGLVQAVSEDRPGKHDYTKKHACVFCGHLDLKISRHLEKKHSEEHVIANLPPPSRNKQSEKQIKREHTLASLRNQGCFMHNIDVLKKIKQGKPAPPFIVARRPSHSQHHVHDYLPCKHCLMFFVKSELWRHVKKCSFLQMPCANIPLENNDEEAKSCIQAGNLMLQGAGVLFNQYDHEEIREEFDYYIRQSLADDEIGRKVKRDAGIMLYGRSQFEKLGKQRAAGIRYRLRLLARIKDKLLLEDPLGDGPDLDTYLRPENFLKIVGAVKKVVEICVERSLNGVAMFKKPEVAKKSGQLLKKLAELHLGRVVMDRNKEERENLTDFLFMYGMQWKDKIGSIAHQTAKERRFNKKELLPATEDLIKLQRYQDRKIQDNADILKKEHNLKNWRELAMVLLCKVQTFNFRRGNETSKMQLSKYKERADWKLGNQEIYESLGKFEQELAKRMDLVEVMGKQNKKVPVLLTPAMKVGIDVLNSARDVCGVSSGNVHVFAKGEDNYISGSEALNHVLKKIPGLKHPELIRFPKMRKYLATVVQLFGIQETELQEVARHMGHELSVHREYYRLQDDVIELAKISKLLLAVESGKAHQFSGVSLDDIELDAIPEVDDCASEIAQLQPNNEIAISEFDDCGTVPSANLQQDKEIAEEKIADLNIEDMVAIAEEETADLNIEDMVASSEQKPQNAVRTARKRRYAVDEFAFDDSDIDPDYDDLGKQRKKNMCSDSDSDSEPREQSAKGPKKKWSDEEKSELSPLVTKSMFTKKPPKKAEVQKLQLQSHSNVLKSMKWIKIKHQAWAMAQQKMRCSKKLLQKC